jgi:uncharacterized membrane protein YbhN (UPF0104 family)
MKKYVLLLQIAFTLFLFYIAIKDIDSKNFILIFLHIDPLWICVALIFNLLAHYIASFRWRFINMILGIRTSITYCIKANFIGAFLSQFVIGGGYGGDVYRIWNLIKKTGSKKKSVLSIFIDRISGFLGALVFIVLVYPLYNLLFPNQMLIFNYIAALSFIPFLVLFVIRSLISFDFLLMRSQLLAQFEKMIQRSGLSLFASSHVFPHLILSMLNHFCLIISMMAIGYASKFQATFYDYLALGPIIFLAKSIPLSVAGWGAREAAMVYFFGFVNQDAAGAIAISIVSGILLLISNFPGMFFLAKISNWSRDTNGKNL